MGRANRILLAVVTFTSCTGRESSDGGRDFAAAERWIQDAVDEEVIPGAVLLVAKGNEVLYEKAYGYARLYDYGKQRLAEPMPMKVDHVFDLASVTKVLATTLGLMLLVDEEKLELDAPVHTYLPDLRGGDKDSITIRHLLTHTAGLYPWKPIYYHADTAETSYAHIRDLPLAYPVGEDRHYSDLGFMLLGYVIEAVARQPLDVFLTESLYEPLGLTSTRFRPRAQGVEGFAATSHGNPFEKRMVADDDFGYECDEDPDAFSGWRDYVLDGEVNDGNAYHAHGGVAGHAGLFSTASDVQVLMSLLLDKGVHDGERFLSEATVTRFLTKDALGNGLGWAMSQDVLPVDELPMGGFGHTGFTGTFVLGVPGSKLSLILLTNRQNMDVKDSGEYASVDPLRRRVTASVLDVLER